GRGRPTSAAPTTASTASQRSSTTAASAPPSAPHAAATSPPPAASSRARASGRKDRRSCFRALLLQIEAVSFVVAGSAHFDWRADFLFGRRTNFQRADERFAGKSRSTTSKIT